MAKNKWLGFHLFASWLPVCFLLMFYSGRIVSVEINMQNKIWRKCLLHSNCVKSKNKSASYKTLPLKQKANCTNKYFKK
jgi:hypothetical protein